MTTNAFVTVLRGPTPNTWEAREEASRRGLGPAQTKAFEDGVFFGTHKVGIGPSKRFAAHYQAGVEWAEAEIASRANKEPTP